MEERKYYPGMRLYTYNPKLFDALDDLKEAIRDNDLGKAEKKLAVLEAGLDLTNFYNLQVVEGFRHIILYRKSSGDKKEICTTLFLLLYSTLPNEGVIGDTILSEIEAEILIQMALAKEEHGYREDGIGILDGVLNAYDKERVMMTRVKSEIYMWAVDNLIGMLGRNGEYDTAAKVADEACRIAYKNDAADYLVSYLYKKLQMEEQVKLRKGERFKERKKHFYEEGKSVYALAKLYKFDEIMKNLNEHGKRIYQVDFEEYFK